MAQILDVQKLRLLDEPDDAPADRVLECDLLVAGAGMGGCAAALAALRAGRSVVLTEETDWPGGQMTSQGVSALDEHRYIETFGGTRSYYELRALVRDYYRQHSTLTPEAAAQEALNPGNGWVSRLCFEPAAGVWALARLLEPFEEDGRLVMLLRHRAARAEVAGDTVRSVAFRHLDGEERVEVRASFVLDATELGDLLPLTGAEYVTGAESAAETGEPGAREGAPAPWCSQSFTYPFVMERRPAGETHRVRRPEGYEENRERQPYTLRHLYHDERGRVAYRMFEPGDGGVQPFWTYRRLIDAANFDTPRYASDLAMINWPGNDFRHAGIIDVAPEEALDALRRAKALSLGFCYWLQAECPRDEGGTGYPELHLRPDVMDTADGLSRYPYIREARRIVPLRRVVETDISARCQPGARARAVEDSVGIGLYAIDIHPAEGEEKIPPAPARPFQIPLSALVPVRLRNLLPACKNIGTTHVTNGAYRLHPVEWNVGESAAMLALFCLDRNLSPHTVAGDAHRLRRFQRRLVRAGIPLHWYPDLPFGHPAYEVAQVLAAWNIWTGDPDALEFAPDRTVGAAELRALTEVPAWAREGIGRLLPHSLPRWSLITRQWLARAAYEVLNL
jgi:hypothetical protein